MKNILMIIDAQNDFVEPSGSLYVPGATQDMSNIINLVRNKGHVFDEILVSLDMHQAYDIGHPCFWVSPDGTYPEPFTNISYQDFRDARWTCTSPDNLKMVEIYLKSLDVRGKVHTVWPEHCIIGSSGANLFEPLRTEVENWSKKHERMVNYVVKGMFPLSEFHGIFGPAVEFPSYGKEAQFNFELQESILTYDNIVATGEAKSHCIGESLEQLLSGHTLDVSERLTILEDCMSNIANFEHGIYKVLRDNGATFTLSTTFEIG